MKLMTRDYRWNFHAGSTATRGLSDSALMAEIGRDLRSMYSDLLKEPLPEHLNCIVRELDKQDHRRR